MPREADKFLFDAVGALTAIEAYTVGLDFPAFGAQRNDPSRR